MDEQRVTVKFDGAGHSVDVETYTAVLIDYATVLRRASVAVGSGSGVSVSVSANEPGSLDVVLNVASGLVGGIFDFITEKPGDAASIVSAATGVLSLRKTLAGKSGVQRVDQVGDGVNISADGDVIYVDKPVFNLYADQKASDAVTSAFSKLSENPGVTGFSISRGIGREEFRAESEDFPAIASSPVYEGDDVRHDFREMTLIVVKPYLGDSKKRKWEFLHEGGKLSAPIADDDFLSRIGSVQFKVGVALECVVDVKQVLDSKYGIFVDRSFTVAKVLSVKYPEDTEPMF